MTLQLPKSSGTWKTLTQRKSKAEYGRKATTASQPKRWHKHEFSSVRPGFAQRNQRNTTNNRTDNHQRSAAHDDCACMQENHLRRRSLPHWPVHGQSVSHFADRRLCTVPEDIFLAIGQSVQCLLREIRLGMDTIGVRTVSLHDLTCPLCWWQKSSAQPASATDRDRYRLLVSVDQIVQSHRECLRTLQCAWLRLKTKLSEGWSLLEWLRHFRSCIHSDLLEPGADGRGTTDRRMGEHSRASAQRGIQSIDAREDQHESVAQAQQYAVSIGEAILRAVHTVYSDFVHCHRCIAIALGCYAVLHDDVLSQNGWESAQRTVCARHLVYHVSRVVSVEFDVAQCTWPWSVQLLCIESARRTIAQDKFCFLTTHLTSNGPI